MSHIPSERLGTSTKPERVHVSGIPIDLFTKDELIGHIVALAGLSDQRIVTYANVHSANLASKTRWFRDFLNTEADAVFCDGVGLLTGAHLLGHKVEAAHRMTPPDFIEELAR